MGIVVIKISFAVRVKERRKQNEHNRLGKREIEIACARERGGGMRIIKQGRPKATKNILRFRCCRCGCEFEADDTEYEQASQIAYVHDGIIATCICPCCGATVYIP